MAQRKRQMTKADGLSSAMRHLADTESVKPMTRQDWIKKFSRLDLKSIEITGLHKGPRSLGVKWSLYRIGSIWNKDEEFHIYVMDESLRLYVENRAQRPDAALIVVTPIWVFIRSGHNIVLTKNTDVMRLAEKNFMRFLTEAVKDRRE